jgi:hypothetical protein
MLFTSSRLQYRCFPVVEISRTDTILIPENTRFHLEEGTYHSVFERKVCRFESDPTSLLIAPSPIDPSSSCTSDPLRSSSVSIPTHPMDLSHNSHPQYTAPSTPPVQSGRHHIARPPLRRQLQRHFRGQFHGRNNCKLSLSLQKYFLILSPYTPHAQALAPTFRAFMHKHVHHLHSTLLASREVYAHPSNRPFPGASLHLLRTASC